VQLPSHGALINAPNHHDETTQETDKDRRQVAADCVQMSKEAEGAAMVVVHFALKRCKPNEEPPNEQEYIIGVLFEWVGLG
jgi:hypothetical protein